MTSDDDRSSRFSHAYMTSVTHRARINRARRHGVEYGISKSIFEEDNASIVRNVYVFLENFQDRNIFSHPPLVYYSRCEELWTFGEITPALLLPYGVPMKQETICEDVLLTLAGHVRLVNGVWIITKYGIRIRNSRHGNYRSEYYERPALSRDKNRRR